MRARCCIPLLAVALLGAREASASDADAMALETQLMLAAPPACTLCHVASDAGMGAADTPFAKSLLARGFREGDAASLAPALAAMKRDDVDSDGDGATDLDELSWGGDPNAASLPASSAADRAGPQTGCSSSGRTGRGAAWMSFSFAVALALATARRARRRIALRRGEPRSHGERTSRTLGDSVVHPDAWWPVGSRTRPSSIGRNCR